MEKIEATKELLINRVSAFKQLCGISTKDNDTISIMNGSVLVKDKYIKELYDCFEKHKIERVVYIFNCGTAFEPNCLYQMPFEFIKEYDDATFDFTNCARRLRAKLDKLEDSNRNSIEIMQYTLYNTLYTYSKIKSMLLGVPLELLQSMLGELANTMLLDISNQKVKPYKLYRLIGYIMQLSGNTELAGQLSTLVYAIGHDTMDIEDASHLYLYEELLSMEELYSMVYDIDTFKANTLKAGCLMEGGNLEEAVEVYNRALDQFSENNDYSFESFLIELTILENLAHCYQAIMSGYEFGENTVHDITYYLNIINLYEKTKKSMDKLIEDIKNSKGKYYELGRALGVDVEGMAYVILGWRDDKTDYQPIYANDIYDGDEPDIIDDGVALITIIVNTVVKVEIPEIKLVIEYKNNLVSRIETTDNKLRIENKIEDGIITETVVYKDNNIITDIVYKYENRSITNTVVFDGYGVELTDIDHTAILNDEDTKGDNE